MPPARALAITALITALAAAGAAHAEDDLTVEPQEPTCGDGCGLAPLSFHYEQAAFSDVDLGTGWIPADSPIQVRIGFVAKGRTTVDVKGDLVYDWPVAVTTMPRGTEAGGSLDVGYGLQVIADLRIDVEVLGNQYTWEGRLPELLDIPADLLFAGTTQFESFALPGARDRPATVRDTIDRINAYTIDLAGAAIPIPGITGEIRIELEGSLEAAYASHALGIDRIGSFDEESALGLLPPGEDGYGPGADLGATLKGALDYTLGITVFPHLEVSILSVDIIDADLAALPLDVPFGGDIEFEPDTASLQFPDLALDTEPIRVGVEAATAVSIENRGLAPLRVTPRAPAGVVVTPALLELNPGERATLDVEVAPEYTGDDAASLHLDSNDPDTPTATIPLVLDGAGGSGGCGCQASSGPGGAAASLLLVLFALFALRRSLSRRVAGPAARHRVCARTSPPRASSSRFA